MAVNVKDSARKLRPFPPNRVPFSCSHRGSYRKYNGLKLTVAPPNPAFACHRCRVWLFVYQTVFVASTSFPHPRRVQSIVCPATVWLWMMGLGICSLCWCVCHDGAAYWCSAREGKENPWTQPDTATKQLMYHLKKKIATRWCLLYSGLGFSAAHNRCTKSACKVGVFNGYVNVVINYSIFMWAQKRNP